MKELESLLRQINNIKIQYEKVDELNKNSFNIFTILRKAHDEVNLHSRFLYDLMNPEGSHKLKDIFLKLFLEEIGIKEEDFACNDIVVYREKENIDILIKNNEKAIIIENKIYSEDHSKQLSRYLENMQKRYGEGNVKVLYLTLFGEEPAEKEMKDKVITISYAEDIKNWLEKCIKETAKYPTIRETIIQYLSLIKELTNQSKNGECMEKIKNLLLQGDNLKNIIGAELAVNECKIELQIKFWERLEEELCKKYSFKFVHYDYKKLDLKKAVRKYYSSQIHNKYYGLEYKIDGTQLSLYIEIDNNIYYGLCISEKDTKSENDIRKKISEKKEFEEISKNVLEKINTAEKEINDDWWIYWKYPEKKFDFRNFNENLIDELNKNNFESNLITLADEIKVEISEITKILNIKP